MSEQITVASRPPIGFIVEGEGEFLAYPGLVSRICKTKSGINIPRINTRGFGGIISNLEEHLDDLARFHPYNIIVTIDSRDALRASTYQDCSSLREDISKKISLWKDSRIQRSHLDPLPHHIAVVIQIQQFETWWLSDIHSLSSIVEFKIDINNLNWKNVDDEIPNPTMWLQRQVKESINTKKSKFIKDLATKLDPTVMRNKSRSFDKFYREVEVSYQRWLTNI